MYEVEDMDDVYAAVDRFNDAVENLTYSSNGELETHVREEVSPALIEAERLLEAAEEQGHDIEEVSNMYREARLELFGDKGYILEEAGVSRREVKSLGCLRRRLEYGFARETARQTRHLP